MYTNSYRHEESESERRRSLKLADHSFYWANNQVISMFTSTRSELMPEQEAAIDGIRNKIYNRNNSDAYEKRIDNVARLMKIKSDWEKDDNVVVPEGVINIAVVLIVNLNIQPLIFPTNRRSVQFEYDKSDDSYLEFEIFEDKITCMIIPRRDYDDACFPVVEHNDYKKMNEIIGDFYDVG